MGERKKKGIEKKIETMTFHWKERKRVKKKRRKKEIIKKVKGKKRNKGINIEGKNINESKRIERREKGREEKFLGKDGRKI